MKLFKTLAMRKGDRAKALCDLSCIAHTIPKGSVVTITARDAVFGCYDVKLDDPSGGRELHVTDCSASSLEPMRAAR